MKLHFDYEKKKIEKKEKHFLYQLNVDDFTIYECKNANIYPETMIDLI